MAINVICPGCHARFKVSDKFAGQKGPCPKCKAPIQIPQAEEQVVIHEPEHSEVGARGKSGTLVLKPIERAETKIQPMLVSGYAMGALLCLAIAFILRGTEDKTLVLAIGAVVLAPPLVWLGYAMFRDDEELEPFRGVELGVRTAICSACYAGIWLLFAWVYGRFFGDQPAEIWAIVLLGPIFLFLGAGAATACFDFDLGDGFFHYALYISFTILLRLAMGLPALGPAEQPAAPLEEETTALLIAGCQTFACMF